MTVYRDTHDVPHVYGDSDQTMAFGAGFVQAEDRLFLMDVLRHYGEGTLAAFLGPACDFEQMDHDQLLLAPYTPQQAQAQVANLPKQYGADGKLAKSVIEQYVAGVNAYIDLATRDPRYLPADYGAAVPGVLPQHWTGGDVVAMSRSLRASALRGSARQKMSKPRAMPRSANRPSTCDSTARWR